MANYQTSSSKKVGFGKPSGDDADHKPKFYLALGMLVGLTMALVIVLTFLYFPVITQELQDPTFRLMSIEQSPFSISSDSSHSSIMQSAVDKYWNITFLVTKPNEDYTFFYNDIETKIIYHDIALWKANPGSFYQEENSQTFIDATFDAMPTNYADWVDLPAPPSVTVEEPLEELFNGGYNRR